MKKAINYPYIYGREVYTCESLPALEPSPGYVKIMGLFCSLVIKGLRQFRDSMEDILCYYRADTSRYDVKIELINRLNNK